MLHIRDLQKYYYDQNSGQKKYVFNSLNLHIKLGHNFALMGRNGSGKSTLINMISGIDMPNKGKIISSGSVSWKVGFAGSFQGSLSARENISFVCKIYGLKGQEIRDVCEFCKDFAEIGDYFEMPIKTYSSGMKARISFGLSMAFDFDLYLLDEVTATGDQFFVKKAKQALLDKMAKSNFIMASHAIGEIRDLCNLFGVIYQKEIILFDNFSEAQKMYNKFGAQ
ncbi:MAG: capsular polysaccharide transport system ATP-binding protein [Rickettsiales bacterium]|jgi:capsular polysaccharide transport system ATP-binding protein